MAALLYAIPTIAKSQTLESLVMPGPVIEGHAEVETECSACHAPFARDEQRALCIDCHEDIGADVDNLRGYHGSSETVRDARCADCHTDHEGRDAAIVELDESQFDHELTDFRLLGLHSEVECADCHQPDTKHRDAPSDCASCHRDDDNHEGYAGEQCTDCHRETGWQDIEFDHGTTDYALLGKHLETACVDCHEDITFRQTPTTCYGCHASDDAHEGRSGRECESCHNPTSWNDSSFDHGRDTDFPMEGKHQALSCGDCHSDDPFSDTLETTCISCHRDDDEHDRHFGENCDSCHVPDGFDVRAFDHDRDTEHPLNGAHESIECTDCHVEPVFEVALQTACNDCHADDDPHDGQQGSACRECHNESSWNEDLAFDHALTRFPLLGLHAEAECDNCHETRIFRDAPEACIDCHEDDDPHEDRFGADCESCHVPVDWLEWRFDHDAETGFALTGAHTSVGCDSCHRRSLDSMAKFGGRCADCHRSDDVHDGEFGTDCGRCHSATTFSEVRAIQ